MKIEIKIIDNIPQIKSEPQWNLYEKALQV